MMMGDDESTVTSTTHDRIEKEANFAAGSLVFLGDRFRPECLSLDEPSILHAQNLKKNFGNSLTTTFWRMVEYAGEDSPMLGFVGRHPSSTESSDMPTFRHAVVSPAFSNIFPVPDLANISNEIRGYCGWRKKGRLGEGSVILRDHDGTRHKFGFETFFNGYDALILGGWKGALCLQITSGKFDS